MKILTRPHLHLCSGRPVIFRGDRVLTAHTARRTAYQRAIRWAVVAPVRSVRPGMPRIELPDGIDPEGEVIGVVLEAGRFALIVSWPKVRVAGDAARAASAVAAAPHAR